MDDLLSTILVFSAASAVLAGLTRSFEARERSWVLVCLAAHMIAAPLQVWMTEAVLGGGDIFNYYLHGVMLAEWARLDPLSSVPKLMLGVLHLPVDYPFTTFGAIGSATHAMSSASGLIMLLTGDSLYGACALVASGNAISQTLAYMAVRRVFPASTRFRLALALLLTPSLVFWTSALLKESLAMWGFGFVLLGAYLAAYETRRLLGVTLIAVGAVPFYALKPYVLAAFFVAAPVFLYARYAVRRHGEIRFRLVPVAVTAGLVMVGVALLGWVLPEYSVEEFAEEAAQLQEVGARVEGGSNVQIVSPGTRSFSGQLAFAPLALITTLFRPLVFEARGTAMLLGAVEATVLSLAFAMSLTTAGRRRIASLLRGSPVTLAGLTFVGVFGVAVGLASTNLGSLSRYRVPMMPFWAMFIALAVPFASTAERQALVARQQG